MRVMMFVSFVVLSFVITAVQLSAAENENMKTPVPVAGYTVLAKSIEYPELAYANRVEGKVILKVSIDENGKVTEAHIVRGIGFGCDESALESITKCDFKPGVLNGKKIKTTISIPVLFKIEN